MSITIGKTLVKIHGILPVIWLFAWFSGSDISLVPAFLAFLIHESGHLLAAKFLKMRVESVEITPYGGVITITNIESTSPVQSFILAAAGPAFSMIGCFLAVLSIPICWIDFSFAQKFFRCNLLLALFNLLPALPLDGGRMLRSLLSPFLSYAHATRVLNAAGNILGIALCLLSVFYAVQGALNLAPVFSGLYLLYASAQEKRSATARYISSLIGRRQKLEHNEILSVKLLAAGGQTPARSMLSRLNDRKYHQILVLSEDGLHPMGILDEQMLCTGIMEAPDATLSALLQANKNGQTLC